MEHAKTAFSGQGTARGRLARLHWWCWWCVTLNWLFDWLLDLVVGFAFANWPFQTDLDWVCGPSVACWVEMTAGLLFELAAGPTVLAIVGLAVTDDCLSRCMEGGHCQF